MSKAVSELSPSPASTQAMRELMTKARLRPSIIATAQRAAQVFKKNISTEAYPQCASILGAMFLGGAGPGFIATIIQLSEPVCIGVTVVGMAAGFIGGAIHHFFSVREKEKSDDANRDSELSRVVSQFLAQQGFNVERDSQASELEFLRRDIDLIDEMIDEPEYDLDSRNDLITLKHGLILEKRRVAPHDLIHEQDTFNPRYYGELRAAATYAQQRHTVLRNLDD